MAKKVPLPGRFVSRMKNPNPAQLKWERNEPQRLEKIRRKKQERKKNKKR